jgi:8-oxo-dGTP pyrophosphatase MutT (NUDIX family)
VLDQDDRIMLLRYDENGGFWATSGGSLESGETHPPGHRLRPAGGRPSP